MAWFADLAGKAETLLNNLDEQTGAALRNHNVVKARKQENSDFILHPDPSWNQRKRPIPRNLKKISPVPEPRSNYTPARKISPIQNLNKSPVKGNQEPVRNGVVKTKKPLKKSNQYTLDNCPDTLVCDTKGSNTDHFGLRQRRHSLPVDLEIVSDEEWTYRMQNLEVENVMLKNELNVLNREVADLLEKLRKTQDGNKVEKVANGHAEFNSIQTEIKLAKQENNDVSSEKDSLRAQLEQIKRKVDDLVNIEVVNHKERIRILENELCAQKDQNTELEDRIKELTEKTNEKETTHLKLESELRHAQSTITELQYNLGKSNAECHRLEKDWETYKVRVKSMLHAKDDEIKSLQNGLNINEESKFLIEQLESVRDERDELSVVLDQVRSELDEMKQLVGQLESRHVAAERVVAALRDALKEERAARNRAESQSAALSNELKTFQEETNQTISNLSDSLREKEAELTRMRESSTSVRTSDSSALNVADYDVTQDTIDNDKIYYLTQSLVQKQGKIDSLLADNNTLRIQLDKLESKYKAELSKQRATNTHSVVHFQDDCRARSRNYVSDSSVATLSMRIGLLMRRYPIFRLFILVYMIGLHLWVFTVLLSNTPDTYITRAMKS